MEVEHLKGAFRYDGKTGHLYRGRDKIEGTEKYEGGPLLVSFKGRPVIYSRVCFAILHGYLPRQVRHRNGRVQDNRSVNLYDPNATAETGEPEHLPHSGRYKGVHVVNCQYSGKFRGYRGSVYHNGKRLYTPVVETPELARDLRQWLTVGASV